MTLPRDDAPSLWIVAGPNGSGKSTLYDATDIEGFGRSVWIINPDLLSARIVHHEKLPADKANRQALVRIQNWLNASILAHQTVGVETVLSTDKYRSLVTQAQATGFKIRLLYVMLRDVELNIQRVRQRVAEGGHDVPEDKIRQRHKRSLQQMPWFLDKSDFALIYDNSGASPKLIGRKQDGLIEIDKSAPKLIVSAIDAYYRLT
jgi:predicted ABC-type ATPase